MNGKPNKYEVFYIYLVLALVTFIAYAQILQHKFVNFDDDSYVTENSNVKAGLAKESILWAFTTAHASNWHPVTRLASAMTSWLIPSACSWRCISRENP